MAEQIADSHWFVLDLEELTRVQAWLAANDIAYASYWRTQLHLDPTASMTEVVLRLYSGGEAAMFALRWVCGRNHDF